MCRALNTVQLPDYQRINYPFFLRIIFFSAALFFFSLLQSALSSSSIRVAAIFSESGIAALHNTPLLKMTRLAVEEVNTTGGVLGRQIELVVIDNGSTPIGSALAAKKAVELGVVAVIGAHWSSHSLAMAPILQEAGIPMITPGSTNPDITMVGDYIFRACFVDSIQGIAMAQFARNKLNARKAAIVSNIDESYSITLAQYFKKGFVESSGIIAADLGYRGNAADFSTIIEELLTLDLDVIYLPGYTRDSGLFIKQARKLGISAVFLGGDAWDEIEKYSGESIEGSYQTAPWHPDVPFDKSQVVQRLFFQKYGKNIENISSPLAFDAVMLLKEAITKCLCTDREKMRDSLAGIENFQGATGYFSFDTNGDPISKEVMVVRFQDNKRIFIDAITL